KAKRTRPSLDEISEVLHSVAGLYSRVFIIVDALDECQAPGVYRTGFLSELFSLQKMQATNILVTSRFIPEITEKFDGSMFLEIRATDGDVQSYLDSHISQLPAFVGRSPDLQGEIKTEIANAVNGMYGDRFFKLPNG